jgi:hypothetical protein
MMWNTYGKPVEYDGVRYGSKEVEFDKIEGLPGRVSAPLEVAVNGDDARASVGARSAGPSSTARRRRARRRPTDRMSPARAAS